ncbi:MAG TPA: N-acetylmuramoyl-L-alanine amidase [Candidatus Sulfotelmatobacter sp.]|jgi:N-acetylmuramoyl-L-alanine amidase/type II secretory pathway predicted ATPase ExeA|nr:N-acetylmuramoyl-L-alanine amidase [Candidatus Sulfotelmatobacter sp.]
MLLEFYGLREQPFGVTPDPAYLYASRTHCEALDSLTEAILGDRGFMALIAEPGMGKTTLLHQVLEGLRETARAVFLFQTQCDSREFFQYLMSELGVDSTGMGLVAMHKKLNEILFAEMLAGRRFVLIVDEAQNLDESVLETIRMLSNFETTHSKLMQIILAGQTQLGEKLQSNQLAQLLQRITVVQYLEPFSPEETAGYIRHRLKVAGYKGESFFEPGAVDIIAGQSQGIPRNINKICFRSLMEGYAAGSQSISAELVEKAISRLRFTAAPRRESNSPPAPTSVSTPSTDDSGQNASLPSAASPGEQPPAAFRLHSRVIGAGAVIAGLLAGGLALPRSSMTQMGVIRRAELAADTSFMQPDAAERVKLTTSVREAAERSKPVSTMNGARGLPSVTSIQAFSTGYDAQVVVALEDAVQFESARISSPDRIYFDLHKAKLGASIEQKIVPNDDGLLKWVRVAQNSDDVVRLVLDAEGAKDFSAKLLSDPYRLVIDVRAQSPASGQHGQLSLARELGLKINRIAIDPGHGGNDTGTTGPHGLLEKDLCLDVGLRLGELIRQNLPGTEVVYTRKDDRHVSLEERTAIANDASADLFISIHANSSDSRQTRGVETFYLSLANSRESSALASRENALAESSLHNLPDMIRKIAGNEKLTESRQFAVNIQDALAKQLQLVSRQETNRGVKQAPFVVLTGANMPAVLSEISFVSNANDESLLLEGSQRQRIAEGLYRGVVSYLNSEAGPPPAKQKLVGENHSVASTASRPR